MNSTEIVIREMQGDSGFHLRQLLAEGIRKPRNTPHLHSHGQVLSLDKTSRDVVRIRPSVDDLNPLSNTLFETLPEVGA